MIIRQGMFLASAALMISILLSGVYASGVVSPYWDSPNDENSLRLGKGDSKVVQFELQNMVGDNDATFKLSLQSSQDVAQFTEPQEAYLVEAGTSVPVPIKISVPSSAQIGDTYRVTFTAQEAKTTAPGQFALGSAFETSFNVLIGEKLAVPQKKAEVLGSKQIIIAVIIILLIIALAIWIKRRKQ